MIKSILIANRGEIASRVISTAREMGIRTIAVYSEADVKAPWVREADVGVCIGPAPAAESYLNSEKILAVAKKQGADAIHPGYGFLSENPDFSAACAAEGLIFLGPSAEIITAMGDKAGARRHMAAAGVPVVPGFDEPDTDEATLAAEAEKIGFPLMIKAVAGGGGRGIRLVEKTEDFLPHLASARRQALSAFGDDRVMLEKALKQVRHVEFQVAGDGKGGGAHLFERECSLQRRHQKLVEETPSPALSPALREKMGEAAEKAVSSLSYMGVGTVEFLLDAEERFYFLEMNTRLQVEHPITEMTLGLDLVRLQIELAEGAPLDILLGDLEPRGHAIECRLIAENPEKGFMPAAGHFPLVYFPTGEGFRVDSGLESGMEITPHYDSLLAKLITWGSTRHEAQRRMLMLLSETFLAGPPTNLSFLKRLLTHKAFAEGRYTTDFVESHLGEINQKPDFPTTPWLLAAAGAVEYQVAVNSPQPGEDKRPPSPWQTRSGEFNSYENNGMDATLKRTVSWGEASQAVCFSLGTEPTGGVRLTFEEEGGITHQADFHPDGPPEKKPRNLMAGSGTLMMEGERYGFLWAAQGEQRWLSLGGEAVTLQVVHPGQGLRESGMVGQQRLLAPLPGKVIKLAAKVGDQVKSGSLLAVVEAMKMEHAITAPYDGKILRYHFAEGAQVNKDDLLLDLEAL